MLLLEKTPSHGFAVPAPLAKGAFGTGELSAKGVNLFGDERVIKEHCLEDIIHSKQLLYVWFNHISVIGEV